MDWIGAALAFALTMLALSLVVTSTVETIHRARRLREKGLRLMFEHFYNQVITPRIAHALPADELREEFLKRMTENRAPSGKSSVNRIWNGDKLGDLPLDEFMARLGDSTFGDVIAGIERDMGKDAVSTVLRDLGHKFEEFGRDASVYFEARARLLSVLVAFVTAWLCYVHPRELFVAYLRDPALAETVIQEQSRILEKSYEIEDDAAAKKDVPKSEQIAAAQREETPAADAVEEASGQTADLPVAAEQPADETATGEADSDTPADKAEQRREELLALLKNAGVPIGWTPQRRKDAGFKPESASVFPWPEKWDGQALATTVWLLLGGILIGLGAPFWRDLVLSLTRLRGGAATEQRKAEEKETVAPGIDRIEAAVGRFLTASQARAVVSGDATGEIDTDMPVG